MNSASGKEQTEKNVLHLEETEHLPAVPNSSQGAEVVKQIIEQILANERRRARIEFLRLSVFFLVFLFAILGTGIWFARQLLTQLREERRFTEQSWRLAAERGGVYPADKTAVPPDQAEVKIPPALNREDVAKLEENINAVSDLLQSTPRESSASIQAMLQNQQNAIQALNARLNESQGKIDEPAAAPEETKKIDFISAPVAEDLNLRMPIPSL